MENVDVNLFQALFAARFCDDPFMDDPFYVSENVLDLIRDNGWMLVVRDSQEDRIGGA